MSWLKNGFFNSDEKRLRAGWRILIFIIFFTLISRILSKSILGLVGDLDKTESVYWVFRGIVVVVASSLVVWLVRKLIDKKTFISLGLKIDSLAVKDFFIGLVISGLMIGIIFVFLYLSGLLEIDEISWGDNIIYVLFNIFLWLFP